MLDVIYEAISSTEEKHLLVCSSGTHKLNLMQSHPHWSRAKNQIVFPDDADQEHIHELIYEIKRDRRVEEMIWFLKTLLSKYGVNSFIAGCSEIHIVAKRFSPSHGSGKIYRYIDPLSIIARQITKHEI
jgi:aspartate racemase